MHSRGYELCPRVLVNGTAADEAAARELGVHLSALSRESTVRLCEPPSGQRAGILLVDDFLSATEVAALREEMEIEQGPTWYIDLAKLESVSPHALLLERRLAAFSRVPHHGASGAGLLQVHKWRDRPTDPLHLDAGKHRAIPYLSALVYLEGPSAGGHTLFPLLEPPTSRHGGSSGLRAQAWQELRERARFDLDAGRFGHMWRSEATLRMCDELRAADTDGSPYMHFGIPPIPGRGLFFWHMLPQSAGPDTRLYHTGCSSSGVKHFVQSFREVRGDMPTSPCTRASALHAARYVQHAACECSTRAVRSTQHAPRTTQHAARSTQHVAHSTQHAAHSIQIQRANHSTRDAGSLCCRHSVA